MIKISDGRIVGFAGTGLKPVSTFYIIYFY